MDWAKVKTSAITTIIAAVILQAYKDISVDDRKVQRELTSFFEEEECRPYFKFLNIPIDKGIALYHSIKKNPQKRNPLRSFCTGYLNTYLSGLNTQKNIVSVPVRDVNISTLRARMNMMGYSTKLSEDRKVLIGRRTVEK